MMAAWNSQIFWTSQAFRESEESWHHRTWFKVILFPASPFVMSWLKMHIGNPWLHLWQKCCRLFITQEADFIQYWNYIYFHLILWPKLSTTCCCCFSTFKIRHNNASTVILSKAEASGIKACLEPIGLKYRVSKGDHQWRNLISRTQCVTKQSLWLTSCVILTLSQHLLEKNKRSRRIRRGTRKTDLNNT